MLFSMNDPFQTMIFDKEQEMNGVASYRKLATDNLSLTMLMRGVNGGLPWTDRVNTRTIQSIPLTVSANMLTVQCLPANDQYISRSELCIPAEGTVDSVEGLCLYTIGQVDSEKQLLDIAEELRTPVVDQCILAEGLGNSVADQRKPIKYLNSPIGM